MCYMTFQQNISIYMPCRKKNLTPSNHGTVLWFILIIFFIERHQQKCESVNCCINEFFSTSCLSMRCNRPVSYIIYSKRHHIFFVFINFMYTMQNTCSNVTFWFQLNGINFACMWFFWWYRWWNMHGTIMRNMPGALTSFGQSASEDTAPAFLAVWVWEQP